MQSSVLRESEILVLQRTVPADVKSRLLSIARQRFGYRITPIYGEHSLATCYRCEYGRFMFWFNTPDHSSHMVFEIINPNVRAEHFQPESQEATC